MIIFSCLKFDAERGSQRSEHFFEVQANEGRSIDVSELPPETVTSNDMAF